MSARSRSGHMIDVRSLKFSSATKPLILPLLSIPIMLNPRHRFCSQSDVFLEETQKSLMENVDRPRACPRSRTILSDEMEMLAVQGKAAVAATCW